jgi:quercetin dioxygenase-like cupin family protein
MSLNASMKTQPFVVTPEECDPALNVLGTKVTVLASNAATQSYEITLQQGDEGTGPPLHSHNWDEFFYVLKGKVEFSCAGKNVICTPGTLVHVPAGTIHGFRYGSGAGEMLELTGQGALVHRCSPPSARRSPQAPPTFPRCWRFSSKTG